MMEKWINQLRAYDLMSHEGELRPESPDPFVSSGSARSANKAVPEGSESGEPCQARCGRSSKEPEPETFVKVNTRLPWETLTLRVRAISPRSLPPCPFLLRNGAVVQHAVHFMEALHRDLAGGPEGPRARSGALQEDLLNLEYAIQQQGKQKGRQNGDANAQKNN